MNILPVKMIRSYKLIHVFMMTALAFSFTACTHPAKKDNASPGNTVRDASTRIPVILDTDANNELDDQHALAYLMLNEDVFEPVGITVNATWNGGNVGEHLKEAERVVSLCGKEGRIPVLKGANGGFEEIRGHIGEPDFDGHPAVDFIIGEAMKDRDRTLVVIPVGKLTNLALALLKEPAIARRIRVVWLGSNYPERGEYNLENDIPSMEYVLHTGVPFEIATVRYGKPSGTGAVKVSLNEILEKMPGMGPRVSVPVIGRHGGEFTCFGDYSANLFSHVGHFEEDSSRSLFDMAAVAIVKDPSWAGALEIPCPVYTDSGWVEQPGNPRKVMIWEDFDKEGILTDFFAAFE
jgi:purine nucleosidase